MKKRKSVTSGSILELPTDCLCEILSFQNEKKLVFSLLRVCKYLYSFFYSKNSLLSTFLKHLVFVVHIPNYSFQQGDIKKLEVNFVSSLRIYINPLPRKETEEMADIFNKILFPNLQRVAVDVSASGRCLKSIPIPIQKNIFRVVKVLDFSIYERGTTIPLADSLKFVDPNKIEAISLSHGDRGLEQYKRKTVLLGHLKKMKKLKKLDLLGLTLRSDLTAKELSKIPLEGLTHLSIQIGGKNKIDEVKFMKRMPNLENLTFGPYGEKLFKQYGMGINSLEELTNLHLMKLKNFRKCKIDFELLPNLHNLILDGVDSLPAVMVLRQIHSLKIVSSRKIEKETEIVLENCWNLILTKENLSFDSSEMYDDDDFDENVDVGAISIEGMDNIGEFTYYDVGNYEISFENMNCESLTTLWDFFECTSRNKSFKKFSRQLKSLTVKKITRIMDIGLYTSNFKSLESLTIAASSNDISYGRESVFKLDLPKLKFLKVNIMKEEDDFDNPSIGLVLPGDSIRKCTSLQSLQTNNVIFSDGLDIFGRIEDVEMTNDGMNSRNTGLFSTYLTNDYISQLMSIQPNTKLYLSMNKNERFRILPEEK